MANLIIMLIALAMSLFSATSSALTQSLEVSATLDVRGDPGYTVHPTAVKKYCVENNIGEDMPFYAALCWDKRDVVPSSSASLKNSDVGAVSDNTPGFRRVLQPFEGPRFRTSVLDRRATPVLMAISVRPVPRPFASTAVLLPGLSLQVRGPDTSPTVNTLLLENDSIV